jgi:hypothetical protein
MTALVVRYGIKNRVACGPAGTGGSTESIVWTLRNLELCFIAEPAGSSGRLYAGWTDWRGSAAVAYLDLSRAVRGVDSLLRQRQGIEEFTEDDDCIFRISYGFAERPVLLSDGTAVAEGEPVLLLHFWNEHLPLMPSEGPSPAWAIRLKQRMRTSLVAVARHIEGERTLAGVRALHGAPPFGSRIGVAQMVRTAHRFGFDVIDPDAAREWRQRVHLVFDSMLLWGLAYAFNPAGLKTKGLLRHRHQLWIARRKLLLLYGSGSDAAPPRADRH